MTRWEQIIELFNRTISSIRAFIVSKDSLNNFSPRFVKLFKFLLDKLESSKVYEKLNEVNILIYPI